VLSATMSACGSSSSEADTSSSSTTPAAASSQVPGSATDGAAVPELLQFTASLVGGGEFSGLDYAGQASAFWFWAPT